MILDPACGSGHFLLYSFDLLEQMYREAWEHSLAAAGRAEGSLRDAFATREDLDRALPDADQSRTICMAWTSIRAQHRSPPSPCGFERSGRGGKLGIEAGDRPAINRTGIVIAEPMPGDTEMLSEFAAEPRSTAAAEVSSARSWRACRLPVRWARCFVPRLSSPTRSPEREQSLSASVCVHRCCLASTLRIEQSELDLSGIDDDSFFAEAEQRLIDALHDYAARGTGAQAARRRLFAGDAGQGVALLELLRQRYDVVLMNPPFGAGSLACEEGFRIHLSADQE